MPIYRGERLDELHVSDIPPHHLVELELSNGTRRRYAPNLQVLAEAGPHGAFARETRPLGGILREGEQTWVETALGRERVTLERFTVGTARLIAGDGAVSWALATRAMLLVGQWEIRLADGTRIVTTPHGPGLFTIELSAHAGREAREAWGISYGHLNTAAAVDVPLDLTVARLGARRAERLVTAPVTRLERLADGVLDTRFEDLRGDRA